jgi:hypothetical protein
MRNERRHNSPIVDNARRIRNEHSLRVRLLKSTRVATPIHFYLKMRAMVQSERCSPNPLPLPTFEGTGSSDFKRQPR